MIRNVSAPHHSPDGLFSEDLSALVAVVTDVVVIGHCQCTPWLVRTVLTVMAP